MMVAGDELDMTDGKLFGSKLGLPADEEQAYASVAKLEPFDMDSVMCYHGGICTDDPKIPTEGSKKLWKRAPRRAPDLR